MANGAGIKAYRAKMTAEAINPTVIIAIIQAILSLLGNCPKPPTPNKVKRVAQRPALVAAALLNQDPDMSEADAWKYAQVNAKVAKESSDEEVQAFLDDAFATEG